MTARSRHAKAWRTAATPCCASRRDEAAKVWPIASDTDLNTPSGAWDGRARQPAACDAGRVLRAHGERAGLITNGESLDLLLCDPGGPDSHVIISLSGRAGWAAQSEMPESYRLIFALASPAGMAAMAEIFDAARLHQTMVTKTLRAQARTAIEGFLQCVLDHVSNKGRLPAPDSVWRQALTIVYRLLFILKLESSAERGAGF